MDSRVEYTRISETEWRVTRRSPARDRVPTVAAIVEMIGNVYGVMLIGRPLYRAYFGCLEEALDMVGRASPDYPRDSDV